MRRIDTFPVRLPLEPDQIMPVREFCPDCGELITEIHIYREGDGEYLTISHPPRGCYCEGLDNEKP